jgi:hypothetical protein
LFHASKFIEALGIRIIVLSTMLRST